jgi:hypothetical protein
LSRGKTPAKVAGIPSLSGFKWHELLKRAVVGPSNTDWMKRPKNEKKETKPI